MKDVNTKNIETALKIPMKVVGVKLEYDIAYLCPTCNSLATSDDCHCGQKLDWD